MAGTWESAAGFEPFLFHGVLLQTTRKTEVKGRRNGSPGTNMAGRFAYLMLF